LAARQPPEHPDVRRDDDLHDEHEEEREREMKQRAHRRGLREREPGRGQDDPDDVDQADHVPCEIDAAAAGRVGPRDEDQEEEGRLSDPRLRENFITRVFAHRRLAALREAGGRRGDVVAFHTAHKSLLLAHSPRHYALLGRMVAERPAGARSRWFDAYGEQFMTALRTLATARKHVNVLQHLTGLFKARLTAPEKRELLGLVEDFAQGLVPLVVPITLINHYVARFDLAYVRDQVYLRPHPKELMLSNHV
jgi:uncharacterized protein YbgA (DUF1722 family)